MEASTAGTGDRSSRHRSDGIPTLHTEKKGRKNPPNNFRKFYSHVQSRTWYYYLGTDRNVQNMATGNFNPESRYNARLLLIALCISSFFVEVSSQRPISDVVWKLDCNSQLKGEKCSYVTREECHYKANYLRTEEEMEHLKLTPYFTGSFFTKPPQSLCVKEERWNPGLNISWTLGMSREDKTYIVYIFYVGKENSSSQSECSQCLNIRVPATPSQELHKHGHTQTISLIADRMSHCAQGRAQVVLVRVERQGSDGRVDQRLEASIAFTVDTDGAKSLPIHFKRLVSKEIATAYNRTLKLNPTHWVTPLVVRNVSCERKISVEFELMPQNEYISKYELSLQTDVPVTHVEDRILYDQTSDPDALMGKVTFYNVSPGFHKVTLKAKKPEDQACPILLPSGKYKDTRETRANDPCGPKLTPSLFCKKVSSGYYAIQNCPLPPPLPLPPEKPSTEKVVLLVIICIFATTVAAGVSVWYIRRKRSRIKFPKKPAIPTDTNEIWERRKKVFIAYCIENKYHTKVVLRLADLLQQEWHTEVILESWETSFPSSAYEWIDTNLYQADVILLVGSEGATKYVEAHKNGMFFKQLEEDTSRSKVFPLFYKALQQYHSASPHGNLQNVVLLTFDYSETVQGIDEHLGTLVSHHYRLLKDCENMLLDIHETSRFQPGGCSNTWATDFRTTEMWGKLEEAIEEASVFHKTYPNWFVAKYGQPERFDNPKSIKYKAEESYVVKIDQDIDLDNLNEPFLRLQEDETYEVSKFISPEMCVGVPQGTIHEPILSQETYTDTDKPSSSKGSDSEEHDSGINPDLRNMKIKEKPLEKRIEIRNQSIFRGGIVDSSMNQASLDSLQPPSSVGDADLSDIEDFIYRGKSSLYIQHGSNSSI